MLFNAARNAQICTLGRHNNTGEPTPLLSTSVRGNHSFKDNIVEHLGQRKQMV